MSAQNIILSRLLREVDKVKSVGLAGDLVRPLAALLPESVAAVDLSGQIFEPVSVDVVVSEALEVSTRGDVILKPGLSLEQVQTSRLIVAGAIGNEEGDLRLVKTCTDSVDCAGCVDLVVTDLGVIRIGRVGFELVELAPGVSSDNVRMKTYASLHVVDGIKRLDIAS